MHQLNVPRKKVAYIQVIGCLVLSIISFIVSFLPMINLQVISAEDRNAVNNLMEKINVDSSYYFTEEDETISVSMPKLIGSIKVIINVISATSDEGSSNTTSEDKMSEEERDTIKMAVALIYTIKNVIDPDSSGLSGLEEESSELQKSSDTNTTISTVINVILSIVAILYCLAFTLVIPIVYLIIALKGLIPFLKNTKEPTRVQNFVCQILPKMITLPMFFFIFQCLIPGMTFGTGALMLWIFAFVAVVLNVVASRMRTYANEEFTYLNILQATSLVGIIGFIVFFFSIIKSGLAAEFLSSFSNYLEYYSLRSISGIKNQASELYWLDFFFILIYLGAIVSSLDYFRSSALRLSCTVTKRKKAATVKDSHIVSAVVLLIACYVLPMIVMKSNHQYPLEIKDGALVSLTDSNVGYLKVTESMSSAFTGALIGLILMLVAEIGLIVLKKVFCSDMKHEVMDEVMTGEAKTPEEKIAEAQQILADAKKAAEEAAAAVTAASVAAGEAEKK